MRNGGVRKVILFDSLAFESSALESLAFEDPITIRIVIAIIINVPAAAAFVAAAATTTPKSRTLKQRN
eukprot:gene9254-biopygen7352